MNDVESGTYATIAKLIEELNALDSKLILVSKACNLYKSVAEDAADQWSDDYLWEKWELSKKMDEADAIMKKVNK